MLMLTASLAGVAMAAGETANGSSATAPLSSPGSRAFESFADLRNDLLNVMGSATKRLWLTTDYLTDGEIVSVLYVAQYRKLDVIVLLGREKANFYMSRLNYLKNQNIPVFLRPDSFKTGHATSILCDDKLLSIDGELDFMTKYKRFNLSIADGAAAATFAATFAGAANLRVPAVPHAIPLVGRPSATWHSATSGSKASMPLSVPHYDREDGTGAFTYDHHQTPRPNGVPAKLPKDLKWEQQHGKRPPLSPSRPAGPTTTEAPQLPADAPMVNDDTEKQDGG